MITHKWQQEWDKSVQSAPQSMWIEALIDLVTSKTRDQDEILRNLWREDYLVRHINSRLSSSEKHQEELNKLKAAHQEKLKSIQANLDEMTSREKTQRERNKILETQVENMRPKMAELKKLQNPENP